MLNCRLQRESANPAQSCPYLDVSFFILYSQDVENCREHNIHALSVFMCVSCESMHSASPYEQDNTPFSRPQLGDRSFPQVYRQLSNSATRNQLPVWNSSLPSSPELGSKVHKNVFHSLLSLGEIPPLAPPSPKAAGVFAPGRLECVCIKRGQSKERISAHFWASDSFHGTMVPPDGLSKAVRI